MRAIEDEDLPPILKSERLLPRRFRPGHTLTQEDLAEIGRLLDYHYRWLAVYEAMRAEKDRQIESLSIYAHQALASLRAPVTGYVLQDGPSKGLYADAWVAAKLEIKLRPLKPVSSLRIRGWKPRTDIPGGRLKAIISEQLCADEVLEEGEFEIAVSLHEPLLSEFKLRLEADFTFAPGQMELDADKRDLSYVLKEIRAEHPVACE
jgi:hypothetical protein